MEPVRAPALRQLLAAMGVTAAGCVDPSAFTCTENAQCIDDGTSGACEPGGFCSFLDPACASLRRYGERAAPDLAGKCVDGPPPCQGRGLAAGSAHSCIVDSEDAVWCWGRNWGSELGGDSESARPVRIVGA